MANLKDTWIRQFYFFLEIALWLGATACASLHGPSIYTVWLISGRSWVEA